MVPSCKIFMHKKVMNQKIEHAHAMVCFFLRQETGIAA
jgi:hypothetical protein